MNFLEYTADIIGTLFGLGMFLCGLFYVPAKGKSQVSIFKLLASFALLLLFAVFSFGLGYSKLIDLLDLAHNFSLSDVVGCLGPHRGRTTHQVPLWVNFITVVSWILFTLGFILFLLRAAVEHIKARL